ncbi:MAG TPA: hypothetical protein VLJ14_06980 [Ktedonobacterales bacterium]|nr:hypothetical protein [Ktedonobacterales bacterium]
MPVTGVNGNPWGYDFNQGNVIYSPPAAFCDHFTCIGSPPSHSSFWSGSGYVVECNDTHYSKSGGVQGACSQHQGVMRILYSH